VGDAGPAAVQEWGPEVDAKRVTAAEPSSGASPSSVNDPCDHPDVRALAERVALGEAISRRASEVTEAVVVTSAKRYIANDVSFEELEPIVRDTCSLATDLIGRYLATGEGATGAERDYLAERSTTAVVTKRVLKDVTKNYLTWRDETLRVVREEAVRLGSSRALTAEAAAVVRFSCDVSIVHMVKEFDVQRGQLQRKLDEERDKLTHLALHDALTGLANRALLLNRLSHEIAGMDRRSRRVGVLYLDLDGFKAINDELGHEAGDRLLVDVAQRLTSLVRPSDTVARLGGDEFVILCVDLVGTAEDLGMLAHRIRGGITDGRPGEPGLGVSVSVGGAVATSGDDAKRVLARADGVMYDAKRASRERGGAAAPVRVSPAQGRAAGPRAPAPVLRVLARGIPQSLRRRRKPPKLTA